MEANSSIEREKKENFFVLHSSMAELNSNNEYCDVTIKVQDQSFRSHRFVLAALSEYFHAMFAGNFKEKRIIDEPIVLHEMEAHAFKLILNFMYSGNVEITIYNISSLLITADFLKLRNPYIEKRCIEFIHTHIWIRTLIHNVMEIFQFSCVTKKTALTDVLRKYICQHMDQLQRNDIFEKISYEDLKQLLLPECPFWIYNQEIVLSFLLGWVHQSHKERKLYFEELVKLVDLKKISAHCISCLLKEYEKLIGWYEDTEEANNTDFKSFSPLSVIDNARSEATITLVIDDFSNFIKEERSVWSQPCMIQNLPWNLKVNIRKENDERFVAVFLVCRRNYTISTWSCSAACELSIFPDAFKKSDTKVSFKEKANVRGYKSFAPVDDVIDPMKGLVKDDIIIFQAHVIADPPNRGI